MQRFDGTFNDWHIHSWVAEQPAAPAPQVERPSQRRNARKPRTAPLCATQPPPVAPPTVRTFAPTYVKSIGGAPLPWCDHDRNVESTIGRFWLSSYQARWQALQKALATKFDSNATLREVNISGTGLISASRSCSCSATRSPTAAPTSRSWSPAAPPNRCWCPAA